MDLEAVMPVVRHILQILAGILVHRGYIDDTVALEIVGLGLMLFTFAWYGVSKSRKALKAAK